MSYGRVYIYYDVFLVVAFLYDIDIRISIWGVFSSALHSRVKRVFVLFFIFPSAPLVPCSDRWCLSGQTVRGIFPWFEGRVSGFGGLSKWRVCEGGEYMYGARAQRGGHVRILV